MSKELSFLWDEYQSYKNIKIYPFLMKDYDLFEDLITLLLFDKNKIPQIEIIKMSYLKFLIFVIPYIMKESNIIKKFKQLLKYVFKEQNFTLTIDKEEKIFINVDTDEQKVILNEHDFDKVKEIILKQNAIPTIKNDLHPDLQKELEENYEYLARKQGYQDGTIEEQIVSYKCEMKFGSYESIKKMTIYQFRKELQRLDLIKDYQIYKQAECSGMVTFNKPIPHWRSHISDKPDYSGLLMSKKEFESKMNNAITNN